MQESFRFFYARILFCNVTLTPLFRMIPLFSKDENKVNKSVMCSLYKILSVYHNSNRTYNSVKTPSHKTRWMYRKMFTMAITYSYSVFLGCDIDGRWIRKFWKHIWLPYEE